ncbi:MAG: exodeoxyribonuclease V subunit beta [Neisseriaceae bacterium]|nr:exodeoxyribonuclease V subunit beta [Neisseriaceae bacterium]
MDFDNNEDFSPLSIPNKITALIEASAGTGKTHQITNLFVKSVVLDCIDVSKIAVLTYTTAATAELKTRLRAGLRKVIQFNNKSQKDSDNFFENLFNDGRVSHNEIKLRARKALLEFDRVGIYTIHGFCSSILNEEAFLCCVPFSIEIDNNQQILQQKLCDDFWRDVILNNKLLSFICVLNKLTPDEIFNDIMKYLNRESLEKRTINFVDVSKWYDEYQQIISMINYLPADQVLVDKVNKYLKDNDTYLLWKERINNQGMFYIEDKFWRIYDKLNKKRFNSKTYIVFFEQLSNYLENNVFVFKDSKFFGYLDKLREIEFDEFHDGLLFINLLYNINKHNDDLVLKIKFDLLEYINNGLKEYKKHSYARTYDDLLLDVYYHRNDLKKRLINKYAVLLVDEFQDTDEIQYGIFKNIFVGNGETSVYLVGDPKQAIYSFRGADIYTYMKAVEDAGDNVYHLTTNYRSHKGLVEVFNALFSRKNPFVKDSSIYSIPILYKNVKYKREQSNLNCQLPALTVFKLLKENNGENDDKKLAATCCARHISLLMKNQQKLISKEIAILVRKNDEAKLMQQYLKKYGIDSVCVQKQSIFVSTEAVLLLSLMKFWLNPYGEYGLWSFVLSSHLFQHSFIDIKENTIINRGNDIDFAIKLREIWCRNGIFSAYQYFNNYYKVENNLIANCAERELSNIYQILELLSDAESECLSEYALLYWLDSNISYAKRYKEKDEEELRLESDADLISIVTIHKSKGLQYQIVYCPFLCMSDIKINNKENMLLVKNNETSLLIGKHHINNDDNNLIENELFSEDLRLLYVALTRAKDALILCDNDSKYSSKNPLHYLLSENLSENQKENCTSWELWKQWRDNKKLGHCVELREDIIQDDDRTISNNFIHYDYVYKKLLADNILYGRYFASYSSWLRRQTRNDNELYEEFSRIDFVESMNHTQNVIDEDRHTFPGGTRTGDCWHNVLENFDFMRSASEQSQMLCQQLEYYQFDKKWVSVLQEICDATRFALLNKNGIMLSEIPRKERLSECHFLLNQIKFDSNLILEYFADSLPESIIDSLNNVTENIVQGFFDGFIDMLARGRDGEFYLIDYKSNKLGNSDDDYTREAMDFAVAHHHYVIQALIYALAVRRYLSMRGVFPKVLHVRYLFLRGLKSHTNQGVWDWDIDCNLLLKLDNKLIT